jgi:DNA helicase-2/ATP-dependent DNA helicase PcrA
MMNILKNLNPRQKEAVETTAGPLLILAGPGSGKTRVLTHRIAHLIQCGINPENILAVTFTNKAADEMRQRVVNLLRNKVKMPFIGTFHAFCLRILRQEIKNLDYKSNFVIYDDDDQLSLIKKIIQKLEIDKEQFKSGIIAAKISALKNELIGPSTSSAQAENYFEEIIAKVYEGYQTRLKQINALDFDDLIMLTVELFSKFPKILEKYQEKFRYILVDEYQDTNAAQYVLIN